VVAVSEALRVTVDETLLFRVEVVFAAVFVAANTVLGWRLMRAWRIRRQAVLTWMAPRPPYYGLMLGIGLVIGALLLVNVLVLRRSPSHWFWELMMVVYYGYLFPLSTRIRQGFYEEGVWAGPAYLRYADIGSLTWREEPEITLLLVPRARTSLARRLVVPQQFYAEARRLLRDRIKAHDIHLSRPELDLLGHDERDDV
jgi:hypothetical protein